MKFYNVALLHEACEAKIICLVENGVYEVIDLAYLAKNKDASLWAPQKIVDAFPARNYKISGMCLCIVF